MCDKLENMLKGLVAKAWDWAKRIFGRSRTIFLNVMGLLGIAWVELGTELMNVDWDALFKHEVAVGIGLFVNVLNLLVRLYTNGPVNFGQKLPPNNLDAVVPEVPEVPAVPSAGNSASEPQKS